MSFESRPELSAITQQVSLNREGLVADVLFPLPLNPTGCKFSYIDWTKELKELKSIDDHVSCKTDAKEIDSEGFDLVDASTKPRALKQVLDECCVTVCGKPEINTQIEAGKTRQLSNKLLIGREERAIALATDESAYEDNGAKSPNDVDAVIDGGLFKKAKADFFDKDFNLLVYLNGINDYANFGKRNVMVTDRATLNQMLTHPSFLGAGCIVDPKTTADKVASLLGLDRIVVADANYNDGIGDQVSLKKLWPKNTIFFASSFEFVTSNDQQFSFGLTGYSQLLDQNTWIDENKGMGAGARMQKIGHDMTEVVLSYKAATLIKLTE